MQLKKINVEHTGDGKTKKQQSTSSITAKYGNYPVL